jgi:hypothetical protein
MTAPRLSGTSLLQLSQTRMVFRATSFSFWFGLGEGRSVEKDLAKRKRIEDWRFAFAIAG